MKHRTKAHKLKVEKKRQVVTQGEGGTYQFGTSGEAEKRMPKVSPTTLAPSRMSDLFHYDIRLIAKDLQKTVVATVFVVVVLIAVTMYLR